MHSVARIRARCSCAFSLQRIQTSNARREHSASVAKRMTTMKLRELGGFDGLEENIRIHAAAGADDDDGYESAGSFDDDEEEEVVVVAMTSDDDDDLDRLEEEAEA